MAWIYLIAAGIMEIGWPLGLKLAQQDGKAIIGAAVAVAFMAASGYLLFLAQREIPMGTAYAVWTSVGAAGTFLVGVIFFGDTASFGKYLGVALIILGVITLKISH